MKLTDKLKATIDSMSYEDMLRNWRFAPIGDALFQDESGDYFSKRMKELRSQPDADARHVAASKSIGWDAP